MAPAINADTISLDKSKASQDFRCDFYTLVPTPRSTSQPTVQFFLADFRRLHLQSAIDFAVLRSEAELVAWQALHLSLTNCGAASIYTPNPK